jgi:hypothetical protein
MGMAGAYGGSGGGDFSRVRQDAEAFTSQPSPETARQLLRDLITAVDRQPQPDSGDNGEPQERPQDAGPRLPAVELPRVIAARVGGDDGGRAGGGTARGGRRRGGGGGARGGGSSRGRGRLSVAGGGVLAAGTALRGGDAGTLATFGLVLGDLAGLDPIDQAAEILDAVIPDSGSLEDAELRDAGAEALLVLLEGDTADVGEVVRVLVTEYVFAMCMTEVGAKLRAGDRPGISGKAEEDTLHAVIRAYADDAEIPADRLSANDFQGAIDAVYGQVEDLL